MKQLFLKIGDLITKRENFQLEESLLACELLNSSLLIPIIINDDEKLEIKTVEFNRKNYILLFTDLEEYDKIISDIVPRTNPFRVLLDLLDDDVEGFIINFAGEGCELSRKFIDHYFMDDEKE